MFHFCWPGLDAIYQTTPHTTCSDLQRTLSHLILSSCT